MMAMALVGRLSELAQLERALGDAADGRGRLALLAGEPGIGKSRLAAEVARRAASTMRVVWGRAWEAGGAPPFWPWIQVLRALRRELPGIEMPAEIARLLPEIRGGRSEEHTSELQSPVHLVCRLLLEKKNSRAQGAKSDEARAGAGV